MRLLILIFLPIFQATAGSLFDDSNPNLVYDIGLVIDHPVGDAYAPDLPTDSLVPAKLTYTDASKEKHSIQVKVRLRGGSRKNCGLETVPTLMVEFEENSDPLFKKFDKLKMVANCSPFDFTLNPSFTLEDEQQRIYLEYMAYQLRQHLTPFSLKTRLINFSISYLSGSDLTPSSPGFFIEPIKNMRKRLKKEQGTSYTNFLPGDMVFGMSDEKIEPENYLDFRAFQELIGNTDWGFNSTYHHNIAILKDPSKNTFSLISYDFDLSSFVTGAPHFPGIHTTCIPLSEQTISEKMTQTAAKIASFSLIINQFKLFNEKSRSMVKETLSKNMQLLGNSLGRSALTIFPCPLNP